MFATLKRTAEPRMAIEAVRAALILAAVIAAGAVIAYPKTSAPVTTPAAVDVEFVAPVRDDWFAPDAGFVAPVRDDWFAPGAGIAPDTELVVSARDHWFAPGAGFVKQARDDWYLPTLSTGSGDAGADADSGRGGPSHR